MRSIVEPSVSDLPLDILVVEDQPDVVEVIRRGLEESGHSVEAVLTGEDGLERASARAYDVIVLDVILPGPGDRRGPGSRRGGRRLPVQAVPHR